MSAMLNQLDPLTVLTNFNQIASAGKQIVGTNVPASVINQLLDLAVKARKKPISSVALVPPLIYPGRPNVAKMHPWWPKKIASSEASPTGRPNESRQHPSADPSPSPSAERQFQRKKAKKPKARRRQPGQDTDDLGSVCSAR